MEPVSAGITAAVSLIGGLLGNAAAARRERKKTIQEEMNQAYTNEKDASRSMAGNTNNALQGLIESYKSVLQRPQWG